MDPGNKKYTRVKAGLPSALQPCLCTSSSYHHFTAQLGRGKNSQSMWRLPKLKNFKLHRGTNIILSFMGLTSQGPNPSKDMLF